jgi:hypothetical protein
MGADEILKWTEALVELYLIKISRHQSVTEWETYQDKAAE